MATTVHHGPAVLQSPTVTRTKGSRQGPALLALDTIISTLVHFVVEWSPELTRSRSRDLLRLLVNKCYGASNGNMFQSRIRCSQEALAAHLGLSREWTCKLVARLVDARWIEYRAPRLPDGRYEVGFFRPGRTLKRMLCMLLGSRKGKRRQGSTPTPAPSRVNTSSQSFPLSKTERENVLSLFQKLREDLAAGRTPTLLNGSEE